MDFVANGSGGSAVAGVDGPNSKRKLDIAHSTPMTVLSMDSQTKVRRRGSSMSSNDSTVMKRSLSDGTINAPVLSDASDSEHDPDGSSGSHRASCPISPSSNTSDSVNEATAQLHAMSPRDATPPAIIRPSPFSPMFPSRSATPTLSGSTHNSPVPSPFRSASPMMAFPGSGSSSPHIVQPHTRISAASGFSVGVGSPKTAATASPINLANTTAGSTARGPSFAKRAWQPNRRSRNPGNLTLDLSQVDSPANSHVDGKTTLRRNDQAAICSQVTDFLFIGGAAAAKDRDNLMQVGITHIINCAANIAPAFYPNDFQYYNIRLRDHSTQDIARYFYNVFDFIEKARRRGGKVFVHCVKGISRSPTMAIAYLMWYKRIDMYKALDFVRQARPAVDPNAGFIFQLTEWEHLRTDGRLRLQQPVIFRIDVPGGCNGNGNGARAAEKPLVVGPLTSVSEADLSRPSQDIDNSVFVVSNTEYVFLWCGSAVNNVQVEAAQYAIELLQTYESLPDKYEVVMSGHESSTFWGLFETQQPHKAV